MVLLDLGGIVGHLVRDRDLAGIGDDLLAHDLGRNILQGHILDLDLDDRVRR